MNRIVHNKCKMLALALVCLLLAQQMYAQQRPTFVSGTIFQTAYFIENNGQYDKYADGNKPVKYGVENAGDCIYFNPGGFVYRLVSLTKKDDPIQADPEERNVINEGIVTMRWINPNPGVTIEAEDKSGHYFSYGLAKYLSYGYKKITYRNLYPDIDVEYIIPRKGGVKYSLIVYPGADLSKVKFTYTGQGANAKLANNMLTIQGPIKNITEQGLVAKYLDGTPVPCRFVLNNGVVSFSADLNKNQTRTLLIDPWIKSITGFYNSSTNTGANVGCNVDFDYSGNLYVYGGDNGSINLLVAKYSNTGVIRWIFMGAIASTPAWDSKGLGYVGNFVVDKSVSKIYMGQGFEGSFGTRIARLDSSGVWDGFMTKNKPNYNEIWDMNFDCASGNVLGIGGGTSSNINMGTVDKVTDSFAPVNITGGMSGAGQDIVKSAFDPNGHLYVLFASGNSKFKYHIFRVNASYTGYVWDTVYAFSSFYECGNKPFCGSSNGYNALGASSKYVFCYDGVNIEAFKTANGAPIGSTYTIPGYTTVKMRGGVVADECGHVYVGGDSGNIKVFSFDSTSFTPLADINIAGMGGRRIHDLRYSSGDGLIYVTGDSIAATVAPSYKCEDTTTLKVKQLNRCSYYVAGILNKDTASIYSFIWKDSTGNKVIRDIANPKHYTDTVHNTSGAVVYLTIIKNAQCGGSSRRFRFRGGALGSDVTDSICPGTSLIISKDTLKAAGTYTYSFTSTQGCDSIVTLHLGVRKMASSLTDTFIAVGDSIYFNGIAYHAKGTYIDTLKNGVGCDSLAVLNLSVLGGNVLVPSSFTPKQGNRNRFLFPIPIRHAVLESFSIFDRWGELVYHSTGNDTKGWDGTYRGQPEPVGTYVYFVTFHGVSGDQHTVKGSVTIVR